MAILGLAGLGIAVVMKLVLERNAENDLQDCERQLEALAKQLKTSKDEQEQISNRSISAYIRFLGFKL